MTSVSIKQTEEDLVSVIMPAYNCAKFIGEAIDSVIRQCYKNWELIVVDDDSTDDTSDIVKKYMKTDSRIKYYKFNKNHGAAIARNKAIELAQGKYISFLDSDDIWTSRKLSTQINIMKEKKMHFTYTSYNKINEHGEDLDIIIKADKNIDYKRLLKECPGNSTVIYDSSYLGKFMIPNIKKRNDYVMWLQIIKKAKKLYGIIEPLGSHRVRKNSLSRNKLSLVKYHWEIYRSIEHLSIIKSSCLIIFWIFSTVFKLR